MPLVHLKIDISGTRGDEAWNRLQHFGEIQQASFGPQHGGSGTCHHAPGEPHVRGEWRGAEVRVATPLLAQYAVSHYLEQERVQDADVEP